MLFRLLSRVSFFVLGGILALGVSAGAQEASPESAPEASTLSPMGTEVAWLVELSVKPGELENVRALIKEMVVSAQEEAGTLSYAWYVSEDGTSVAIYERYADDAAALAHQAKFPARFKERFLAAMTVTRFTVFGAPGEEVRATVSSFNPTYLQPFGGFSAR